MPCTYNVLITLYIGFCCQKDSPTRLSRGGHRADSRDSDLVCDRLNKKALDRGTSADDFGSHRAFIVLGVSIAPQMQ